MSWFNFRRKPKPVVPPVVVPTGPTFIDTFNTGSINTANWTVSTWTAPMGGKFNAKHIDLSKGMLGIKLVQNSARIADSIGGELTFKRLCGYGTYEWIARASSTANTPSAPGVAVSGSITGLFNYVGDSDTELDLEVEGNRPTLCQATTWNTVARQTNTQYNTPTPLDQTFHSYKYVWSLGKVQYYLDNVLIATHLVNVPTAPAYPMINHWGTVTNNWGGVATPGVERWLWIKSFSFTAA